MLFKPKKQALGCNWKFLRKTHFFFNLSDVIKKTLWKNIRCEKKFIEFQLQVITCC